MIKKSRLCILMALTVLMLSSCYAIRAYRFRKFNLLDHEKLPSAVIKAPAHSVPYFDADGDHYKNIKSWLDSNLQNTGTAAFLVIKNDTVVYERYVDPYTRQTLLPSFSVAKSFVSALTGIALEEGKIVSLNEPITNYIPEFKKKDNRFEAITIQHLLDMRSGIKWNEEDYGLKDDAIKMVFRPNMMKHVLKIKIDEMPGGEMEYKSINTLLLAIIIERATHKKLPVYLEEKLWQPLGMESYATWNKDKRGLTIGYAALNAVARDFAKLGTLFLNKGNFNGKQLVAESWVNASINKDTLFAYGGYRNQWWGVTDYKSFNDSLSTVEYKLSTKTSREISTYIDRQSNRSWYIKFPSEDFYAEGILGQFIYACPSKKLVMVRLGHNWYHPKYYVTDLFKAIKNKF
jgi:CubicO group peptidase (beta-lactamase class C family)